MDFSVSNMKVLNMHVTNVNIRQNDRTSLRLTNYLNTKVYDILGYKEAGKRRYNKPLYNPIEGGY